ncbi:MAG: glycine zipper 2TM domain-containing protein [Sphingomonas sp.]|nr:glycine zipper 2TM domain-containing protein [Sphingomonas sp.]
MFKKSMLVLSAVSMAAVPATAEARHYHRYDNGYGYAGQGYYPQQAYGYDNGYYGRTYGYRRHRCSGTTGTIIGAGAGALLGRSIGRGRYHQHSGTTGTIVGAALGALVGREVGKSTC